MRIKLALALALLPAMLSAQERYTVRGRIVDEQGAPVEYVQVGVPRLGIGAVSTAGAAREKYLLRPGTAILKDKDKYRKCFSFIDGVLRRK